MGRLHSRLPCIVLLALLAAALPGCGGGGGGRGGGGGGGGGAGYGGSGDPNPGNPTPPSPTGGAPDVVVTIVADNGAMSFSPDPVVISAGQRIAWRNADSIVHTATGIAQGGFDTREIAAGAASSAITFTAAGQFDYRCNVHPTMVGTVTVR